MFSLISGAPPLHSLSSKYLGFSLKKIFLENRANLQKNQAPKYLNPLKIV